MKDKKHHQPDTQKTFTLEDLSHIPEVFEALCFNHLNQREVATLSLVSHNFYNFFMSDAINKHNQIQYRLLSNMPVDSMRINFGGRDFDTLHSAQKNQNLEEKRETPSDNVDDLIKSATITRKNIEKQRAKPHITRFITHGNKLIVFHSKGFVSVLEENQNKKINTLWTQPLKKHCKLVHCFITDDKLVFIQAQSKHPSSKKQKESLHHEVDITVCNLLEGKIVSQWKTFCNHGYYAKHFITGCQDKIFAAFSHSGLWIIRQYNLFGETVKEISLNNTQEEAVSVAKFGIAGSSSVYACFKSNELIIWDLNLDQVLRHNIGNMENGFGIMEEIYNFIWAPSPWAISSNGILVYTSQEKLNILDFKNGQLNYFDLKKTNTDYDPRKIFITPQERIIVYFQNSVYSHTGYFSFFDFEGNKIQTISCNGTGDMPLNLKKIVAVERNLILCQFNEGMGILNVKDGSSHFIENMRPFIWANGSVWSIDPEHPYIIEKRNYCFQNSFLLEEADEEPRQKDSPNQEEKSFCLLQ